MTLDFAGRVALVTGAGRGLGRAYALQLASRGCRVVVNDLGTSMDGTGSSAGPADETVTAITAAGGHAVADHHDVVEGAEAIVAGAIAAFGRLDIVINNAGTFSTAAFARMPAADWERQLDIHVLGTTRVCRAAWPHLVACGAGRVVNTASPGLFGMPHLTSYAAAKGAIVGLSRALALDGRAAGVTVNCLFPNGSTRMHEHLDEATAALRRRHFTPERVAAFVTWLVHQDTAVTSHLFVVGGGQAAQVTFAVRPFIAAEADTPEAWSERAPALLADGALTPIASISDMTTLESAALGFGAGPTGRT